MPTVARFYGGRSVFVTGASGFVGKQIVEKLLRSCPDVERVYVLMRQKKGVEVETRLEKILSSPVFDELRRTRVGSFQKVVPIAGDLGLDNLGISDVDRDRLEENVSVVIHSAATLNFMEPLRDAVNMNVLAVQRLLTLCQSWSKLEALVHISTCYSQVNRKDIEEEIYEPPVSPARLLDMVNSMTDEELAVLTPYLLKLHRHPNTYTFTKAVAEKLIEEQKGDVPCAILRLTIVGASLREPFEGWVDNYTGMNGMYVGIGVGFVRSALTHRKVHVDTVPVDMSANAAIVAAWNTATLASETGKRLSVYHMSSGDRNRSDIRIFVKYMADNANANPYSKVPIPNKFVRVTESRLVHRFYTSCVVPLICTTLDAGLRLLGKTPTMMRRLNQAQKLQEVLEFFTLNQWFWSTNRLRQMFEKLDDADRKEFGFDVTDINWKDYMEKYWTGLKRYVLRDTVGTEAESQKMNSKFSQRFSIVRALMSYVALVTIVLPQIYFIIKLVRWRVTSVGHRSKFVRWLSPS